MDDWNLGGQLIEIPDHEGIWNGDMAGKEKDIKEFIKRLRAWKTDPDDSRSLDKFLLDEAGEELG